MKIRFVLILLAVAHGSPALAADGRPQLSHLLDPANNRTITDFHPSNFINLSEDTVWAAEKISLPYGTVITTFGHSFKIKATYLEIGDYGDVLIRSFPAPLADATLLVPSTPPSAPSGSGASENERGPGTEGPPDAGGGANGSNGNPGRPGSAGTSGSSAGALSVDVTYAKGIFYIDNFGTAGTPGGDGANAGNGGNGFQGGRGVSNNVAGVVVGCKSGAGIGGDGGRGGQGGDAGTGGSGGSGGSVSFAVKQLGLTNFKVVPVSAAGAPLGSGGLPGNGGRGGGFGYGGRGNAGCDGEELSRRGNPGVEGSPGNMPAPPDDGKDGCFTVSNNILVAQKLTADPATGCLTHLRYAGPSAPADKSYVGDTCGPGQIKKCPPPSPTDVFRLWSMISQSLISGDSTSLALDDGGVASVISNSDIPSPLLITSAVIEGYLAAPVAVDQGCDLHAVLGTFIKALQSGTPLPAYADVDCARRIEVAGNSTFIGLRKAFFVAVLNDLIAHEIAFNSVLLADNSEKTKKSVLSGTTVYYIWPVRPDGKQIATILNEKLITKLIYIMHTLHDSLVASMSEDASGTSVLTCDSNVHTSNLDLASLPSYGFTLNISTGNPTEVWARPEEGPKFITLNIKTLALQTYFETSATNNFSFQNQPTPIVDYNLFLRRLSPRANPFSCISPDGSLTKLLADVSTRNILNNMPASVTLFGSIYLKLVFTALKLKTS